jgi:hypothetical protein
MKPRILYLGAIIAVLSIAACKKREEPVTADVAGKGGSATIKATPKHHSRYIDSCTVYIKYNTLDLPAGTFSPSQYDDSIKCVKINDSTSVGTFTSLKKGKYFLYGVGWDKKGPYAVAGGLPVTISADITYDVTLAITEGD